MAVDGIVTLFVSSILEYATNLTITLIAFFYFFAYFKKRIDGIPFYSAAFIAPTYWYSTFFLQQEPDYQLIYFQYICLEVAKILVLLVINYIYRDFSKVSWCIFILLAFNTTLFLIFDSINRSDAWPAWLDIWIQFYQGGIIVSDLLMAWSLAAYYWLRPQRKQTLELNSSTLTH